MLLLNSFPREYHYSSQAQFAKDHLLIIQELEPRLVDEEMQLKQ